MFLLNFCCQLLSYLKDSLHYMLRKINHGVTFILTNCYAFLNHETCLKLFLFSKKMQLVKLHCIVASLRAITDGSSILRHWASYYLERGWECVCVCVCLCVCVKEREVTTTSLSTPKYTCISTARLMLCRERVKELQRYSTPYLTKCIMQCLRIHSLSNSHTHT